jgi:flagellar protein FliO/FliZ
MINTLHSIIKKGVTVSIFLFPFFSVCAVAEESKKIAEPISATNILQIFFWLAIVVSIIVFLTWMLKKFSGVNTNLSGTIKLVAGIHVGQREKLALVQVGQKQILIGITQSKITKLHVMEENVEISEQKMNTTGTFAEKLRQAMNKGK